jgi:hypothetical protein
VTDQNIPLARGEVAITPFFTATQEFLGASAPSLYLTIVNATTLKAAADTEDGLNAVAIKGKYRYRTTAVEAVHPGGAAGTYNVWVTGSANAFTSVPTVDTTVYAWGLSILPTASTPGTALYRKVAEVDWSGAAITALRHLTGVRRDDAPIWAATPLASVSPLIVKGAAAQSAALAQYQNSAGTTLLSITSTGALSSTIGITDSSAAGLTLSGAGGKTTLNITNTGTNTGLTLGADTTLYRSGAGALKTDGTLTVVGSMSAGTYAGITLTDATDLTISATTGSKIGQSTSKMAFYGATPVVRTAAYTNSSGLTASRTLAENFTLNGLGAFVVQLYADLKSYGLLQ